MITCFLKKLKFAPFLALFCFSTNNMFAQTEKPNILIIMLDDAGIDMSAYGSTFVKTPAFDFVAQNGILLKKAYTPNAKCAPSRAAMMTGRNSWQLEGAANHWIFFPPHIKTCFETLRDNQYNIGFTGKGYQPGKALDYEGKNRNLLGKEYSNLKLQTPTPDISKIDYAGNFDDFLNQNTQKQWAFWVGINEPHRPYQYHTGVDKAKKSVDMISKVPSFWPDCDSVRNDMLDYALELEYADAQVQKILNSLKEKNMLDNTLILFTSDHGMPFPRMKGNQYERSNHIPMAIMWNKGIATPNRKIDDYISFVDITPTILAAAGIKENQTGMLPITGKSLLPILQSNKAGQIIKERNFVMVGQERHDIGRPNDVGYPIRGLHKNNMLYLKNYETNRWPACNPETGYLNCDGGTTKTYILNQRRNNVSKEFWQLCFGKRPSEELYDISKDPDCVKNLIQNKTYAATLKAMQTEMETKLKAQGDYRMSGYGYLYEQAPLADERFKDFYKRYMGGEKIKAGWINETDYEKAPIND